MTFDELLEILSDLHPEVDFTTETGLIDNKVLDSFDIVSLVDAIESEFDVQISGMDVIPENFNSVESILKTIQKSHK